MESNFHGDLADIFRPGSVNSGDPPGVSEWQYFDQSDQETQMIQKSTRNHDVIMDHHQGFGQPFTSLLADPLILDQPTSSTPPCFFGTTSLNENHKQSPAAGRIQLGFDDNNNNNNNHNHNMFSKMLQISSKSEIITSSSNNSSSSSKRSLLEASTTSLQISSPRNPAIKRRKSQAKKVVCIPAPTPVNSRPTGEVVPSDLWAWRKYGQKPIKGSPYPRGYYRCSSSKGCSARKQVERSRTDPNMLVITYTSEHNHPWPTQRNALAGSTRAPQPPKTATETTEQQQQQQQQQPQKESIEDEGSALLGGGGIQVKDELQVLEGSFPQGYRPELPGSGGQPDDFFSGLGEIEVDPISMLLNHGFLGGGDDDEEAENYNKDLDPFS
ncbi:putative transcription factor WRKY family [Helianthus annuus]|uniref:Putative WRKY domain-containing protein n=1 Tax=Helianthus annuus TaxID=4232 RepID=A0A251V0N3_HELAN|nr:probable WRKY transcription factor 14 [Helianthus annuus]KAF5811248.1 putative transcription factor WRKY family [Helianthus annuus]